MLSKIYLIRHGRTAGNLNHWYYGSTDLPLTDDGYEEIKAYQESGIYPDIPDDADIYTTGLYRTDQTLEAIYGEREHTAIPKLQEIDFGKAECMTYDDLKKFDNFEKWAWDTTGDERIADAETSNEFHARIHEGLKELLEKHSLKESVHRDDGKDAVSVVVCHGGVIACIMEKLFPAVCGSMWDWLPEPGFGYAVDFENGDPFMYSRINDIGRLGLGVYRLPVKGNSLVDHKKTRELFDAQLQKGHGYIELDFLVNGALGNIPEERAFKTVKADLVKRYDRGVLNLTAVVDAARIEDVEKIIRLTGAGYLDRLAVSGIESLAGAKDDPDLDPETLADKRIDGPDKQDASALYETEELDRIWKKLGELKRKKLIKKTGIAFSGTPSLLDELLKNHTVIDYVELPVNYRMGTGEADLAQKYYTISRRRYKEILVRSPFDGGRLAALNEDAKEVLGLCKQDTGSRGSSQTETGSENADDEILRHSMAGYAMLKKQTRPKTAVEWALRYVLSFPFVVICVASTGDPEHAKENMDTSERFRPLTEEDRKLLAKAATAQK